MNLLLMFIIEAFPKTCKPPSPMFSVKFPNVPEKLFQRTPGEDASVFYQENY